MSTMSSCEKYTEYQPASIYCLFEKPNIDLNIVYEKKILQINFKNDNINA